MKSWHVNDKVGSTRNNPAELIEPIPENKPKLEKEKKRARRKKSFRPTNCLIKKR
jgi:hypothetical protein